MGIDRLVSVANARINSLCHAATFTSKWLYAAAIYPALITIPYLFVTDRYSSLARIVYVLLCSCLALAMLFVFLSGQRHAWTTWFNRYANRIYFSFLIVYALAVFYLSYFVRIRNGMGIVEDVALVEQILWGGSQGKFFYSSIYNGSALNAHFSVIFIPLTILFRLIPDIGIVFAVQAVLLPAASILIYLMAKASDDRILASIMGIAFLLSPAVISQPFTLYLNHFAIFFWLAAALAFWRKRFATFVCFSILAASVQEDIAFSLLIFALLAWLENRQRSWKLFSTIFPILWFTVAMLAIQANASATGQTLGGNFTDLGTTPLDIGQAVLANPQLILGKFLGHIDYKMLWVYELTSPFFFIVPFASLLVAAAFPDWIVFSFSSTINRNFEAYSVAWYYSLFITAVLFAAFVNALSRPNAFRLAEGAQVRISRVLSILLLSSNLAMLPLVLSPDMFETDGGARIATLAKIKTLVPDDACAVMTLDIAEPFARRLELQTLGPTNNTVPYNCPYVIINQQFVNAQPANAPIRGLVSSLEHDGVYDLVLSENQILFLVRK